jgi:hypothetical protein
MERPWLPYSDIQESDVSMVTTSLGQPLLDCQLQQFAQIFDEP